MPEIGWTRCTRIKSVPVRMRTMLAKILRAMKERVIFAIERRLRRPTRFGKPARARRRGRRDYRVGSERFCTDFNLADFRQALAVSPVRVSAHADTPRASSDVDVSPAIYRPPWRVILHRGIPMLKFSFGLELEVSSRYRRCAYGNGPSRNRGKKRGSANKSEVINLDALKTSSASRRVMTNDCGIAVTERYRVRRVGDIAFLRCGDATRRDATRRGFAFAPGTR